MAGTRVQDTPSIEATTFWEIVSTGIRAGQAPATGETAIDTANVSNPADLDNPYYRAGIAVRELLEGEDPELLEAGMTRFTALMDLYGRNVLNNWLRASKRGGDSHDIHPAIIDVAARMRLSPNGRFAQNKFLSQVEAHASHWYGDDDRWPEHDSDGSPKEQRAARDQG